MNNKMTSKLATFASAIALLGGISINAQAAQPWTAPYQAAPYQAAPYQAAPYQAAPYQAAPYQNAPRQAAPYQNAPRQAAPYQNAPRQVAPAQAAPAMPAPRPAYGYPNRAPTYGTPWGGNNRYGNTPRSGNRTPWSGSRGGNNRFGGMPWGGNRNRKGFGNGMPMDFDSNFTPWSERFWDDLGEGGRNPFKDMDDWFDPNEPREGLGDMWDDLLNAPADMGKMPGGWTAPSISVPNPVDVQEEFQDAAKDVPDEIRYQMDNINIQTW